jgi:hypothetical protein
MIALLLLPVLLFVIPQGSASVVVVAFNPNKIINLKLIALKKPSKKHCQVPNQTIYNKQNKIPTAKSPTLIR